MSPGSPGMIVHLEHWDRITNTHNEGIIPPIQHTTARQTIAHKENTLSNVILMLNMIFAFSIDIRTAKSINTSS